MLEEDLRSPCTEEIAVFRAFAREVAGARRRFVVLDTAPTGHTLLLLDASEAYHREVAPGTTSDSRRKCCNFCPACAIASFTRVLLVTLPEATPVHEAASLQDDLRRAQNRAVRVGHQPEPHRQRLARSVLRRRETRGAPYISEVVATHSKPDASLVPLAGAKNRSGSEHLRQLSNVPLEPSTHQ